MGGIFYEMNQWLLGDFGRTILNAIKTHMMLFLVPFAIYGCFLLYARIIYMYYIPSKIRQLVKNNKFKTPAELGEIWEVERSTFPSYILVPTKKEMWIQPLKKSSGNYQMLFFNQKNSYLNEKQLIKKYAK